MRGRWRKPAVLAWLAAWLLALPTLGNDFAIDDHYLIVDNPAVRSVANIPGFFAESWGNNAGGEPMYTRVNAAFWRPLTTSVMTLEYAAFGAQPMPYHAINALLHACAAALAALLCARVTRSPAGAIVGGLLFAVHPVHSEVIAAITYQTSLLSALCTLASLLAVQRALDEGPRLPLVIASCLLPALALLAKEDAVVVPLLALASCVLQRGSRAVLLRCVVPMFASTALVLLARAQVVVPSGITYFGEAPAATVARTMLATLVLYVELLLVPLRLCVFYDWFLVPFEQGLSPRVALGALVVLAWLGGFALALRRDRTLALALAWLAIPLLPVLHVVPILNVAAERFLYVSVLGLSLASAMITRAPQRIALAVVLGLFALRTVVRLGDWRDDRTLNEATARDFPETPTPLLNLAELDLRARDPEAARAHLEEALRRAPGFPPALERLRALQR